MNKKIGILTFEQFNGKQNIGSSRIRGEWLCRYWPEAEIFKMGQHYDVIIFQKVYWLEYARLVKKLYPDTIMILDMCDADFLHWGYRIVQFLEYIDAITTSTVELAKYMTKLTAKPVWCIPDRLDLAEFAGPKKVHKGDAMVAAWFGYSENFPMLNAAIISLVKNNFTNLIVIASSRQPYHLPPAAAGKLDLVNYPWTLATVNGDLLKADLVLNPQINAGRWKYKSNNKTITAWALGLPVAHNAAELVELIPEAARIAEAEKRVAEVYREYDIVKSVQSFKSLIAEL